MAAFGLSAILAALTIVFAFALRILTARRRARRLRDLVLRPNCLLTRYPIVFLARPPSLFRLSDDWRDLPGFLREHGYEVLILTPAKRADAALILASIEALKTKCHLIAGRDREELLHSLADSRSENLVSLTLIDPRPLNPKAQARIAKDLRPTRLAIRLFEAARATKERWAFEARFLDHAISLAEYDAGWCDGER